MAAGTAPIFTEAPRTDWGVVPLATANTTIDLTSGTILLVFTAGADGSYLSRIKFRSLGTNTATVARVWINNGATTATLANNILWGEITLAATTVSQVAALVDYEMPLGFAIPAAYRVYCTTGTTVAAGYAVSVVGGDY